jgi:hypothetical protein
MVASPGTAVAGEASSKGAISGWSRSSTPRPERSNMHHPIPSADEGTAHLDTVIAYLRDPKRMRLQDQGGKTETKGATQVMIDQLEEMQAHIRQYPNATYAQMLSWITSAFTDSGYGIPDTIVGAFEEWARRHNRR